MDGVLLMSDDYFWSLFEIATLPFLAHGEFGMNGVDLVNALRMSTANPSTDENKRKIEKKGRWKHWRKKKQKENGTFAVKKQFYYKENINNEWNRRENKAASQIPEVTSSKYNLHYRGSTSSKQDENATPQMNDVIPHFSKSRKSKNYEQSWNTLENDQNRLTMSRKQPRKDVSEQNNTKNDSFKEKTKNLWRKWRKKERAANNPEVTRSGTQNYQNGSTSERLAKKADTTIKVIIPPNLNQNAKEEEGSHSKLNRPEDSTHQPTKLPEQTRTTISVQNHTQVSGVKNTWNKLNLEVTFPPVTNPLGWVPPLPVKTNKTKADGKENGKDSRKQSTCPTLTPNGQQITYTAQTAEADNTTTHVAHSATVEAPTRTPKRNIAQSSTRMSNMNEDTTGPSIYPIDVIPQNLSLDPTYVVIVDGKRQSFYADGKEPPALEEIIINGIQDGNYAPIKPLQTSSAEIKKDGAQTLLELYHLDKVVEILREMEDELEDELEKTESICEECEVSETSKTQSDVRQEDGIEKTCTGETVINNTASLHFVKTGSDGTQVKSPKHIRFDKEHAVQIQPNSLFFCDTAEASLKTTVDEPQQTEVNCEEHGVSETRKTQDDVRKEENGIEKTGTGKAGHDNTTAQHAPKTVDDTTKVKHPRYMIFKNKEDAVQIPPYSLSYDTVQASLKATRGEPQQTEISYEERGVSETRKTKDDVRQVEDVIEKTGTEKAGHDNTPPQHYLKTASNGTQVKCPRYLKSQNKEDFAQTGPKLLSSDTAEATLRTMGDGSQQTETNNEECGVSETRKTQNDVRQGEDGIEKSCTDKTVINNTAPRHLVRRVSDGTQVQSPRYLQLDNKEDGVHIPSNSLFYDTTEASLKTTVDEPQQTEIYFEERGVSETRKTQDDVRQVENGIEKTGTGKAGHDNTTPQQPLKRVDDTTEVKHPRYMKVEDKEDAMQIPPYSLSYDTAQVSLKTTKDEPQQTEISYEERGVSEPRKTQDDVRQVEDAIEKSSTGKTVINSTAPPHIPKTVSDGTQVKSPRYPRFEKKEDPGETRPKSSSSDTAEATIRTMGYEPQQTETNYEEHEVSETRKTQDDARQGEDGIEKTRTGNSGHDNTTPQQALKKVDDTTQVKLPRYRRSECNEDASDTRLKSSFSDTGEATLGTIGDEPQQMETNYEEHEVSETRKKQGDVRQGEDGIEKTFTGKAGNDNTAAQHVLKTVDDTTQVKSLRYRQHASCMIVPESELSFEAAGPDKSIDVPPPNGGLRAKAKKMLDSIKRRPRTREREAQVKTPDTQPVQALPQERFLRGRFKGRRKERLHTHQAVVQMGMIMAACTVSEALTDSL